MSSTRIREARVEDLPQLIELFAEHARFERASIEAPSVHRLSAALFDTSPRLHAWVAEGAQQLIGYITASKEFSTWSASDFMHMDCLYVREAHRGQRIGHRLIEALMAYASALDIAELQWQTPDWNVDAQRFYVRLGASGVKKVRFRLTCESREKESKMETVHRSRIGY